MPRVLLLVAVCGLVLTACGSGKKAQGDETPARPSQHATVIASSAQALRTCVDRWKLSEPHPEQRVCTVSLADRPGDNTWICQIGNSGGYYCPLITSDGMPHLRNPNGMTDHRGVLKLDVPMPGTHPTPALPWQRRYRHVDGFILPWTRAGKLRPGLRFDVTERGPCVHFVEQIVPRSAVRCIDGRTREFSDSCFPRWRNFRAGDLAACGAPGETSFTRWRITGR
jgi:hypothetical protein